MSKNCLESRGNERTTLETIPFGDYKTDINQAKTVISTINMTWCQKPFASSFFENVSVSKSQSIMKQFC